MIKGITHDNLGPIWYHSEPINFPYSPNQFLGWDIFATPYSKTALAHESFSNKNQLISMFGSKVSLIISDQFKLKFYKPSPAELTESFPINSQAKTKLTICTPIYSYCKGIIWLQVNLCQNLFFLQNMGRTCCVQKLF